MGKLDGKITLVDGGNSFDFLGRRQQWLSRK